MKEIVQYHNDFNKIKLPNFNELEQNLLCAIFVKIKNKGHEE
ncbi:RepB family plasmid replication initiator protein, partial [Campylobacter upsaliensis]